MRYRTLTGKADVVYCNLLQIYRRPGSPCVVQTLEVGGLGATIQDTTRSPRIAVLLRAETRDDKAEYDHYRDSCPKSIVIALVLACRVFGTVCRVRGTVDRKSGTIRRVNGEVLRVFGKVMAAVHHADEHLNT